MVLSPALITRELAAGAGRIRLALRGSLGFYGCLSLLMTHHRTRGINHSGTQLLGYVLVTTHGADLQGRALRAIPEEAAQRFNLSH